MGVKEKIYLLVESCDDDSILQEALKILQHKKDKEDWWNTLNKEQQNKTLQSLRQSDDGNTIANQEVINRVWSKFSK